MIVRFFQRHAGFFAVGAGLIGYRLILPENSPWWLELPTGLAITFTTYILLYKLGITGVRGRK